MACRDALRDSVGGWDLLSSGLSAVGQELIELADRRGRDAGQDVAEIGERINPMPLTGGDETEQDGGGAAAVVRAAEEPVLAAEGHAAQSVLGGVVVDGQVAVGGVQAKLSDPAAFRQPSAPPFVTEASCQPGSDD